MAEQETAITLPRGAFFFESEPFEESLESAARLERLGASREMVDDVGGEGAFEVIRKAKDEGNLDAILFDGNGNGRPRP